MIFSRNLAFADVDPVFFYRRTGNKKGKQNVFFNHKLFLNQSSQPQSPKPNSLASLSEVLTISCLQFESPRQVSE